MIDANTSKIAYAAGLMDGEGCIKIVVYKNMRRSPRHTMGVEVKMCRPEGIMLMRELFGGRVYFHRKASQPEQWAGCWYWVIDSHKAAEALKAMLPYLQVKRAEAEIAIKFQQLKMHHGSGRSFKVGLTQAELAERQALKNELHRLKKIHWELQAEYTKSDHNEGAVKSGEFGEHLSETIPSQAVQG